MLNVSGRAMRVSEAALERYPDCMLAKMLSGVWEGNKTDEKGRYLVPRDPNVFRHVLDYMCTGKFYTPTRSTPELLAEFDFFCIIDPFCLLQQAVRDQDAVSVRHLLYTVGAIPSGFDLLKMAICESTPKTSSNIIKLLVEMCGVYDGAFFDAVKRSHPTDTLKALLDAGGDVYEEGFYRDHEGGLTGLNLAIREKNETTVRFLVTYCNQMVDGQLIEHNALEYALELYTVDNVEDYMRSACSNILLLLLRYTLYPEKYRRKVERRVDEFEEAGPDEDM